MHIFWALFVNISERILDCVFVYPNSCSQLVALEVLQGCFEGLIVRINLLFHDAMFLRLVEN